MTKQRVAQRRRRFALLQCIAALLWTPRQHKPQSAYALTVPCRLRERGHGRGYGAPGHQRTGYKRPQYPLVWKTWRATGDNDAFRALTCMSMGEFAALVDELRYLESAFDAVATKLTFEDKMLMLFIWLVHYTEYRALGAQFGCSNAICSAFLYQALLLMATHFTRAIPNRVDATTPLHVSHRTVALIDSVLHAQRPDTIDPLNLQWNVRRCIHGMATHLLVDHDGLIASFVTAVPPSQPEAEAARHFDSFESILDGRRALGDAVLYRDVPYVVACSKPRLSEAEQAAKQFIGGCRVLSDAHRFAHTRDKHIECVFIVCGWHNYLTLRRVHSL